MVERVEATFAIEPQSLGADKAYGSGKFLAWLLDRNIAPHIRVIDRTRQNAEFFTRDDFVFEPEINAYAARPASSGRTAASAEHRGCTRTTLRQKTAQSARSNHVARRAAIDVSL